MKITNIVRIGGKVGLAWLWLVSSGSAEVVSFAADGTPTKNVSYPAGASSDLQASATILKTFLDRITGGAFGVTTYTTSAGPAPGIILGKGSDLNLLDELPVPPATVQGVKMREDYLIATANGGSYVLLVGTTDKAVRNAVYDFLEELGCRWYFANPNWEIVPELPSLSWTTPGSGEAKTVAIGSVSLNMTIYYQETPDFKTRSIWSGYLQSTNGGTGQWLEEFQLFTEWKERNRLNVGIGITAGHAYGYTTSNDGTPSGIVEWAMMQNPSRWNADPNPAPGTGFDALVTGQSQRTPNNQLCLSNPALQQVFADYANHKLAATGGDSVSLEPNDGKRWCVCSACQAIQAIETSSQGYVSDRVVTANNYAAAAIPANKFIGMYAYNMHLAPPSIPVHNNIYVLVASAYHTGGYTTLSLLDGWGAKAMNLGVRDYLSVAAWDGAMPARARASNLTYIGQQIPSFYDAYADVYNSEATAAFGPFGLGFYCASKVLWNVNADTEAIKTEFLNTCFGPAAETMRDFYDRLDAGNGANVSRDLLGRLFRGIDTARQQIGDDPAITARLNDLTLWLRHCELQLEFENATEDYIIQSVGEQLLRHAWKIRNTSMVDSLSIWRRYSDQGVTYPAAWNAMPHAWKDPNSYTHSEIVQMNTNGIANNPLLPAEPRTFSNDLIPYPGTGTTTYINAKTRYKVHAYIRANAGGVLPSLSIVNGSSSNKGDAAWHLYTADGLTELESGSVPYNHPNASTVTFATTGVDNYLFVYDDGGAVSQITWPTGSRISVCASPGRPFSTTTRAGSRYWFYVPQGTQYVIAYAKDWKTASVYVGNSSTAKVTIPSGMNMDIVIPVGPGEDGKDWNFGHSQFQAKSFQFLNIPGLMAVRQDGLLVPEEAYP